MDSTPPDLLDYSFEVNPLTNEEELFLNILDDSGEPVSVEVKENYFSEWKTIDESELSEAPYAVRLTDASGNRSIFELRESNLDMLPWIAWFTAFLILAIFTYIRPRFRH